MGLSRKDLWSTLLFSGIHTQETHRFLKIYISRNNASLTERGIDRMNCKKSSKILGINRLIKLLQCKYMQTFQNKEKWLKRSRASCPSNIPRSWNLILMNFECTRWLFCLSFPLFWNGAVITAVLRLPHHLSLEADNLTSGFTDQQVERNFAIGWITPRVAPIPDLDI